MTSFDIRNKGDVECICYNLVGKIGELFFDVGMDLCKLIDLPTNEPILYNTGVDGFYSIQQHEILNVISIDSENRLPIMPSDVNYTIVLCNDLDYFNIDLTELRTLINENIVFCIHTPSRIIAPLGGIYYSSASTGAISPTTKRIIQDVDSIINPLCVGRYCSCDAPHLALSLDKFLVKERDEDYIGLLKTCKMVYVLDEFSKFLLSTEGIEAEIL